MSDGLTPDSPAMSDVLGTTDPTAHPTPSDPSDAANAQPLPSDASIGSGANPGDSGASNAAHGSSDPAFPRTISQFTTRTGEVIAVGSPEAAEAEATARRNDRAHVFHSWSAQRAIDPLPLAHAEGPWIFDYSGKGYLDLGSQLVSANLGHGHPEMVEAIRIQAGRITNLNPAFASDVRGELAQILVDRAQGEFSHVFFTNGGADAIEHAIRLARLTTGKSKVLSAYRSYHGATGSAMMATGEHRRHGNQTTDGDIRHFWGPFLYRTPFHSDTEEQECERALTHLEQTLVFEDDVAAVLIEPVVGSSGVIVPPPGYLQGVREICDRHGALWIADEVMVGFGRTGRRFAYEHAGPDIQPDLVTFAKGVNSGMVPLGGVMMTAAIAERFAERPYPGGLTYSGHPLAAAAGVAAQGIYEREDTFARVADLGARVIAPRMQRLQEEYAVVGHTRGAGFFWAIEFVADQATKAPVGGEAMAAFAAECKAHGVWPMVVGNRTHVAPPLVTTEAELCAALDVVDRAIAAMD